MNGVASRDKFLGHLFLPEKCCFLHLPPLSSSPPFPLPSGDLQHARKYAQAITAGEMAADTNLILWADAREAQGGTIPVTARGMGNPSARSHLGGWSSPVRDYFLQGPLGSPHGRRLLSRRLGRVSGESLTLG